MMGCQSKQTEWWADPVDIFTRIPEENLLRRLKGKLDLSFVGMEVANKYGRKGNVSVDPAVIMKMMLLLFLDDIKSERELMRIIPLRLDYLYFLGYGLQEVIPNHSVLSKARQRWGKEVFESLFRKTIEQCLDAGLIDGSRIHVDASLVRADASLNSVVKVTVGKLQEDNSKEEHDEGDGGNSSKGVNEVHRVNTDPDATLVRHRTGKSLPSYKNHRVLDDKAGVITAMETTTGSNPDGAQLPALIDQHKQNVGRKPKAAIADSAYGTSANYIEVAKRGIRSHMADLRSRQKNVRQEGIYPPERFLYNPQKDSFSCPAGRKLYRHHFHAGRGYFEYRTKPGVCSRCRLAHLCTRAKAGRTLKRYKDQELLDRGRKQSHGPAARRDRKRRQWFQERNFGEAATQHSFKRSRWRGLWKQAIQDLIIAAIQNLKILIRKSRSDLAQNICSLCRYLEALLQLTKPSLNIMASFSKLFFNSSLLAPSA